MTTIQTHLPMHMKSSMVFKPITSPSPNKFLTHSKNNSIHLNLTKLYLTCKARLIIWKNHNFKNYSKKKKYSKKRDSFCRIRKKISTINWRKSRLTSKTSKIINFLIFHNHDNPFDFFIFCYNYNTMFLSIDTLDIWY